VTHIVRLGRHWYVVDESDGQYHCASVAPGWYCSRANRAGLEYVTGNGSQSFPTKREALASVREGTL